MSILQKTIPGRYDRKPRIAEAVANQQLHDAMKLWRDEYVRLTKQGVIGLHPVTLTGDYMVDGVPCSAAVQSWQYAKSLRAALKATAGADPRTDAMHEMDAWQAEMQATREGDYPR